MRRAFLALSVILLLGCIYLLVLNFNNYLNVNLVYSGILDAQTQAGFTDQGGYFYKAIRVSSFIFLILLSGIVVGSGTVYMFLDVAKDKVKAYQRELEKTSISGVNNASRVEVLEAKIKTLEKAFNTVIDERTQLEVQIKTLNNEIETLNKKHP
jgi:septal ring factor EnvC (AmiA/AmiB activator)